jgi:hypothetical protein
MDIQILHINWGILKNSPPILCTSPSYQKLKASNPQGNNATNMHTQFIFTKILVRLFHYVKASNL